VVGKGGVGKTTTAGALALALAERGASTHLISTDPAHSLGDLFGEATLPGEPTPSPCTDRLVLEELDADAYTRRWMARARTPLVELFDRGTYLDREDVEGFLDLSLPGVDEVAAVLRLAELADSDAGRIVVDTAPTGHTLRLLDAGAVVRSWTAAFDAIAEKAAAVIGQLMRRPVRFDADRVTEELQRGVERFDEVVLRRGSAVLVERAGSVVEAESARLHHAIERRGVRVALRVRVASGGTEEGGGMTSPAPSAERVDGEPTLVVVPFQPELVGCGELRRWGAPGPPPSATPPNTARGNAAGLLRGFPPLLLFVGKGGVGKSSCAAATALTLARGGNVLLLGTDPAAALADVLGVPMPEGEARPAPGLEVRQVRAEAEFREMADRYRESVARAFEDVGLGGSAALDQRVLEGLLGLAPPGVDEALALTHLVEERPGPAGARRTVVDTAPTGHFLRLLAMPTIALAWTRQLLKVIRKYRAVIGLDVFAERLLHFAKQLRELNLTLSDRERSAAIVVTQPGPLVAAESGRLIAQVQQAGVRIAAVIANRDSPASSAVTAPPGVPVIHAPALDEPPVGVDALERFAERWTA
jgi:arsenite-transporting ATPase